MFNTEGLPSQWLLARVVKAMPIAQSGTDDVWEENVTFVIRINSYSIHLLNTANE